jgi:hypothetical protein
VDVDCTASVPVHGVHDFFADARSIHATIFERLRQGLRVGSYEWLVA